MAANHCRLWMELRGRRGVLRTTASEGTKVGSREELEAVDLVQAAMGIVLVQRLELAAAMVEHMVEVWEVWEV